MEHSPFKSQTMDSTVGVSQTMDLDPTKHPAETKPSEIAKSDSENTAENIESEQSFKLNLIDSVVSEVKEIGHTTKEYAEELHNKAKETFDISAESERNASAKKRTDRLNRNALTGLFLVLHKGKWQHFPRSMKTLWIGM